MGLLGSSENCSEAPRTEVRVCVSKISRASVKFQEMLESLENISEVSDTGIYENFQLALSNLECSNTSRMFQTHLEDSMYILLGIHLIF